MLKFFSALLLIYPILSVDAHAQISARANVNIGVVLEDAPPPPLELTVERPLSFGRVNIPNQIEVGTTCFYVITPQGAPNPGMRVSQIRPNGTSGVGGGCGVVSPHSTGLVRLRCENGRSINYRISIRRDSTPFINHVSVSLATSITNYPSQRLIGDAIVIQSTGTINCRNDPDLGSNLFELGAVLSVDNLNNDAPRRTALVIGTYSIEVNY
ncbi:hypothetical protein [Sphingomonas sp. 35-24ZXX]|uniref:hypothetical protein n=1 Tax=Sphingomonas sp. 35-24ZXX TaxID=1545915 RepID=UPI0012E0664D|nr:hypothetical protein [Sphingomonas sp. 35-24ZXX]